MLGPSRLVKGESDAGVVEGLADEIAALGRDVGVLFAENLGRGGVSVESLMFSESPERGKNQSHAP